MQQFSKKQNEGLLSDSHQHPCTNSEFTHSTCKDKFFNSIESSPSSDGSHSQQQIVPVDVSLEDHADYSSELFSSSGTTANDSVILVCSDSSSQLKEPEAVYVSNFGVSLKEPTKSIHTQSLLLNHSNTNKDVIDDSSSAMFVTNSEANAVMELDQPIIIICSESTNDSHNILEASSDSTDSSSCDELSGCSSDECADLLSNRLYRLRKRKCIPVQSHPECKRAKISDPPQTGKKTRKIRSKSRKVLRKKKCRKRKRYINVHVWFYSVLQYESTTGADASVEALKLYHMKLILAYSSLLALLALRGGWTRSRALLFC